MTPGGVAEALNKIHAIPIALVLGLVVAIKASEKQGAKKVIASHKRMPAAYVAQADSPGGNSIKAPLDTQTGATSVQLSAPSPYLTFHLDASDNFDPNDSNLIFAWDFGDGIRGRGIKAAHAYSEPGEYKVTLTVKNRLKPMKRAVEFSQVLKANLPPRPAMQVPERSTQGEAIKFDASESMDKPGDTLTYIWDFGDSLHGKGRQITHSYSSAGTYQVKLTVVDDKETFCSSASISRAIQVGGAAPGPLTGAGTTTAIALDPDIRNAGISRDKILTPPFKAGD